jgi:hypothetical protein
MATAMCEEAEELLCKEVPQLCTVTDLKYKGDNGGIHG